MALTADQLNTIYQNVLFRNVDTAGIQFFANRTDISDAQVRQQIELSQEASTFVSPIVRLYQEVLGRVPDAAGLRFFSNQLRTGTSLDNVAQQLVNSAEFSAKSTAVSGAIDATDLTNTNQLVSDAFQSILGRTPASGEFAFFQGRTPAQILSLVAGSPEAASTNAAGVVTFLDSVAQGTYPTGTLGNQTGGTGGSAPLVLTTAADALTGTAGNDVFTGAITFNGAAPTATSTLTVADSINGSTGTDRLNVTVDGTLNNGAAAVPFPAASISSVEQIYVRNVATENATADNLTFNASNAPGLTQFWNDRSTSTVAVTNLAAGATVGIKGDGVVSVADTLFTYATATSAVTLSVDGGVKATTATDVTNTASGATTATINSTGAANALDVVTLSGSSSITSVTINATTGLSLGVADNVTGLVGIATNAKVTITGAGAVDLNTLATNFVEVDAAGNSGGVTINAGFGAGDKFTGGSGDDTLTVSADITTGSANAGAGTGDRLIVTDDAAVATATLAAKYTNFEILRAAEAAADTYDLSTFTGITSVEVDGSSNVAFTGASSQTFKVIGDNIGDLSITNPAFTPGGADALTLTYDNSVLKNGDGVDSGALTLTNVDTLTVSSVGGNLSSTTQSNSITSLAASTDLNTVTITGDTNFSLTTGASSVDTISAGSFTGALTLDASSNSTGLTITSGQGNDTITGSASADSINAGAGNNTITGGNGIDSINLSAGSVDNVSLAGILAATNRDVVTGFTVGASTVTGADKVILAATDTTASTSAGDPIVIQDVAGAPTSTLTFTTNTSDVLELSFNLRGAGVSGQDLSASTDGTALLAALGQTLAVSADTNKGYIVAYQNNNAYLYHVVEGNDANDVNLAAGDIALVGTFNNIAVGGFTANNFTLS